MKEAFEFLKEFGIALVEGAELREKYDGVFYGKM